MSKTDQMKIISDETLTYSQELLALARLGENLDSTSLPRDEEWIKALKEHKVCDLGEGLLPYRPRYILPDYDLLMNKGCEFLELNKPSSLLECCNNLLIFYKHVPSITSYPVYLGNFTEIFLPFENEADNPLTEEILRLFLKHIDKTLCDSFVHANIGPKDSKITRIILKLTKEMQLAIPNLTLLYDKDITSDDFAKYALEVMLKTSKPSFANHKLYYKENPNYAIASCYNALSKKGGGYTLPRLRLYEISTEANSIDEFFNVTLPKYVNLILKNMDQRIKFIVEESSFFKSNFLVKEGFVDINNFSGMVGVVGVAECSNNLLKIKDKSKGYGHSETANELGLKILEEIEKIVENHNGYYSKNFNNKYKMHAQVGIDSDGLDDAPGARIPIGYEPDLYSHLLLECKAHKYFPFGVGDIFKLDDTWNNSLDALLDIIKGSFDQGLRYFTAYNSNNDVVRVTGYLVKRSEIEKLENKKQSLNNVTVFGMGAKNSGHALDRKIYGKSSNK